MTLQELRWFQVEMKMAEDNVRRQIAKQEGVDVDIVQDYRVFPVSLDSTYIPDA